MTLNTLFTNHVTEEFYLLRGEGIHLDKRIIVPGLKALLDQDVVGRINPKRWFRARITDHRARLLVIYGCQAEKWNGQYYVETYTERNIRKGRVNSKSDEHSESPEWSEEEWLRFLNT